MTLSLSRPLAYDLPPTRYRLRAGYAMPGCVAPSPGLEGGWYYINEPLTEVLVPCGIKHSKIPPHWCNVCRISDVLHRIATDGGTGVVSRRNLMQEKRILGTPCRAQARIPRIDLACAGWRVRMAPGVKTRSVSGTTPVTPREIKCIALSLQYNLHQEIGGWLKRLN
eukprot:3941596-Rhodomonas_salina.5